VAAHGGPIFQIHRSHFVRGELQDAGGSGLLLEKSSPPVARRCSAAGFGQYGVSWQIVPTILA